MQSIDGTTHFELDHEDMDLIISGLAEASNDGTFPVDKRTRARDLQSTLQTITRLWNWWQFTAAAPIGGK
ncbi:hypothetical protein BI041_gp44 [Propionibacterium phage PFR2]|uniref:Uncharacterized protein n=3 Tax=root TaxID=1 RepID=A0A173G9I5_9CAUD|nr:hypothetical protein [Propionibacterium freudenreichii]YP_009287718.1 hypothetical protein BI042_gp42 [Propionibacterium phage PFR1]YP_009290951.1 hypothetical protein BI041_gp44 [Propionibacterium phage PFR2]ANH49908.1 hypothetical protein PFR_42 [Propionibacterium phage PFR1]ANH49967.1 hypothetical protein PFR2_42 [Propionibacterium phage PFR2]MDK9674417.1 hypothetical protein [Propionibacterium freudenreichii]CEI46725.1 Protein of unknown function [Propionibacterium freudenreichii]SCQ4